MLILVVVKMTSDRDSSIRLLMHHGVRVKVANSGREALDLLRLYAYDLVLMDLHLSDAPGHEIVRMMRAASIRIPVMMMSNGATVQAKVRALDQGADDFLIMPCDSEEIVARIQAVVRRCQEYGPLSLTFGPIELRPHRHEALVHGRLLHLSRLEYTVLELLIHKQGKVLGKGAFLTHLYRGMDGPDIKMIDVLISRLRKKLNQAGAPMLIGTIRGCGYALREPHLGPMDKSETHAARERVIISSEGDEDIGLGTREFDVSSDRFAVAVS